MRRAEVFKIAKGRMLVDLDEIVAVEHHHDSSTVVLYARGGHSFQVDLDDSDGALGVIERWLGPSDTAHD